jgi:hypothetical protein
VFSEVHVRHPALPATQSREPRRAARERLRVGLGQCFVPRPLEDSLLKGSFRSPLKSFIAC